MKTSAARLKRKKLVEGYFEELSALYILFENNRFLLIYGFAF